MSKDNVTEERKCLLVIIGATEGGKKELLNLDSNSRRARGFGLRY
jgi:hypothetical protein